MTRTMNPSAWAKRLAAVLGTSLLTLALVTPTTAAQASLPKPDLSKKPRMAQLMNSDFGTPGVVLVPRVLNYEQGDGASTVYREARISLEVKGFRGPVTVWAKNIGTAYQKNTARPWQKIVATPRNGRIIVTIPVAKRFHCAGIVIRVNDQDGRWTKSFPIVRVRDTQEPHDSNGGSISW